VNHLLGCSAFADHAVVSRRSLVRIDRDLPFDEAALFGCAVLTGVGAVINTARVQAGSSVAVIGLGGVGLAALLGAVAAGARSVLAVDLSDDKLGLARQLGATETFNAGAPDVVESIRAATSGGVEYAFEMAGSVRAMDLAYKITRRGGTTVTAGLPPPTHTFNIPQVNLVAEERTVKGSYIGTCVPTRDIPRYIELYRRGKLPVDRLMSSHLTLDDINLGFDLLHEGRAVRQIVTMWYE
jgi:Zn-dependent alcohol dehydrogenase